MGDYKKAGKKKVEGKKTPVVVYKKAGSSKLYVMRKGRMMSYVNYKKMCAKKLMAKVAKKVSKVRKVRKVRKGGEGCGNRENFLSDNKVTNDEEMAPSAEIEEIVGGRRQKQRRQQQQQQQQQQQRQLRRQRQLRKQRQLRRQRGGNVTLSEGDFNSLSKSEQDQMIANMQGESFTNSPEDVLSGGARRYRRSSRSKQSVRKQRTRSRSRSRSRRSRR